MKMNSLTILLLVIFTFASTVNGEELTDSGFGFRATIPDGYRTIPIGAEEPDFLYRFVEESPEAANTLVIQFQRMRGTIPVGDRLAPDETVLGDQGNGISISLESFQWRGTTMDVFRTVSPLPDGSNMIMRGIQFPLAGEAIQLQVGGVESREQEARHLFESVAGSFQNTQPLPPRGSTSRNLSPDERTKKLSTGIFSLAVTVLVVVFLITLLARLFRRKSTN